MKLVLSARDIAAAVRRVAKQIDRDYAGKELHLLGVLKGSFLFLADLVREIRTPCTVDFMQVSSYGGETASSGAVREKMGRRDPVAGRHVLVVEEIVDSGLTLAVLLEELRSHGPASLGVCTLIDKTGRRERHVPVHYRGISLQDGFLVGYGLDLKERFRNLPAVYELSDAATPNAGKEKKMAVWTCPTCNYEKDSRCKPKKCPDCDKPVEFQKKGEAPAPAAKKVAAPAKAAKKVAAPAKPAKKAAAPAKAVKKAAPVKAEKKVAAPAKAAKKEVAAAKPANKAAAPAKPAKKAAAPAKPAKKAAPAKPAKKVAAPAKPAKKAAPAKPAKKVAAPAKTKK